jgi:NADPH:quinone reductase-like Zn-dependent oxidoreductase
VQPQWQPLGEHEQNREDTMKAVIQVGYGSADVLELKELNRPVAADDEVLVRVHAASLAAGDYFGM